MLGVIDTLLPKDGAAMVKAVDPETLELLEAPYQRASLRCTAPFADMELVATAAELRQRREAREKTSGAITIEVLSQAEEMRLDALEAVIDQGMTTFEAVGMALYEIRESKLYRADHATFDDYLESRWDITRQRAAQLVAGAQVAQVAVNHGLHLENERQARALVGLTEEQIGQVSRFMVAASGNEKPTAAQIKAVAEVVREIDASATVEHPDTGEQVEFSSLPPTQQAAIIRENVSTATHERMERQKTHIAEASAQETLTSGKSWSDWVMNYVKENPSHSLYITVEVDASGNPQALAEIRPHDSADFIASGEPAPYLKKAVLSLVEEVKG